MGAKHFHRVSLTLSCLLISSFAHAQETATPTPTPNAPQARTVSLSLIVTDQNKHSLDEIIVSAVEIRENGIAQHISSVTADVRPLDYSIAIDTSGSFRYLLPYAIEAAKIIVQNSKPNDEVFLERFISSDKIETVQEFTSDQNLLLKQIS